MAVGSLLLSPRSFLGTKAEERTPNKTLSSFHSTFMAFQASADYPCHGPKFSSEPITLPSQGNASPRRRPLLARRDTKMKVLLGTLGFLLAAPLWSQSIQVPDLSSPVKGFVEPGTYLGKEMQRVIDEQPGLKLSDLTLAQYADIARRLQIAKKKDELLNDTIKSSLFIPGSAQFQDSNYGGASLFLASDLGVLGLTGYLAYLAIPADYVNSTKSIGLNVDLVPAMAVVAGGWVAWEGLGILAAIDAVPSRKKRLDTSQLTIVPEFKDGEMGFSLKW